MQVIAPTQKGSVIEVATSITMDASRISLKYNLPAAESIILSTERAGEGHPGRPHASGRSPGGHGLCDAPDLQKLGRGSL
ncbi:MAG: hypothetical protein C4582_11480 [Desulfobacteraceae bacterium]|nr:MAG: hypothetical protein C4582_11480 [Desulfobacteraceae bacterium]